MTEMTEATQTQAEAQAAETTLEDLITINQSRAQTYGLLSRLFRKEVDQELLDEMYAGVYRVSTGNANVDEGHKLLATYLSGLWDNSLTELAADYMRTFFGHGYDGHSAAYPFESVYASEKRLLMQGARDEVLAIYRAAGLGKQESWKEGEDHIALELEYMQIMSERVVTALQEGNEDEAYHLVKSQSNFLEDHLGNWACLLCEQMQKFARTTFYQGLAYLTEGFIEVDAELMHDLLTSD